MHTNAYKGGGGGLNMIKNTHFEHRLLKILQYLNRVPTKVLFNVLDKIHNRCIRIIEYKRKGNRTGDIQDLMSTYQIENISYLLCFLKVNPQGKIHDHLKTERPDMVLRNSSKVKFNEKFTKKTVALNSSLLGGYKLWNDLSEEYKSQIHYLSYKNQ